MMRGESLKKQRRDVMKSSGGISAGWSFTAGTFFGAFAVFAVPAALHSSRAGAGISDRRLPVAAVSVDAARAPEAVMPAGGKKLDQSKATSQKAKPGAPDLQRKSQGHSELDLQLD
jgi:hypothetical protein